MTSEVARILAQIDLEIEAFRRLFHDPAQVASHAAIQHRMAALGSCHEELCALVPEEEAAQTLTTVLNTIADAAQSAPRGQQHPSAGHASSAAIEHSHSSQEELASTMSHPPTPAPTGTQTPNESLIHIRLERRWSKKETARRLGISSVVYAAWETGRHEPTLPHLRALCRLFACPPEALGFPIYLPVSRVDAPDIC